MSRRPIDARLHLLPIAMLRYPGEEPLLALEFYLSDRNHAGLGALGGRENKPAGKYGPLVYSRSKTRDLLHRRVNWCIRNHRRTWDVLPPFDSSMLIGSMSETVTVTRLPELIVERWVTMIDTEVQDRRGRMMAAQFLRQARAEVRKEWPPHGGLPQGDVR